MHAPPAANPTLATRKEWIGLAILALPTLLLSLDMSVLYLAIPELSADLNPSSTQLLWVLDIYGFMIAGFLVTMGTLGDRIGRRKLLLIGATAFSIASLGVAFSQSAEMLIVSRAFLGIAGATLMPSTLALISNMFHDERERGIAIAAWMSCFGGGTAIGPLVGGAMLEFFWWGSAFLLGVPVMVTLLVFGPRLLPEHRDANAGRIDLVSVLLSLATILPIVYGIKELAKEGFHTAPIVSLVAGGLVGIVFVRRQLHLDDPVMDVRLFGNRLFTTSLVLMLVATISMGGIAFLIAQYLQLVAGLTPFQAGLGTVPGAVAMIFASMSASAVVKRIGVGNVLAVGFVLGAAGMALITQVNDDGSIAMIIATNVITSIGLAPVGAICTNLVIGSAPPERAGSASAMSETSAEMGISLGVAALGSLAGLIYRQQVSVPDGVTGEAATAGGDSLPGAVAASGSLEPSLAAQLVDAAQEAFTSGLHVVAGVGGVAMFLVGVLAYLTFRRNDPAAEAVVAHGEPGFAPASD